MGGPLGDRAMLIRHVAGLWGVVGKGSGVDAEREGSWHLQPL